MSDGSANAYDIVVIGGGTAGSNAARAAKAEGARVVIVRKPDVWNLCVQEGCMPSKSLIHAGVMCPADTYEHAMEVKAQHVDRLESFLDASLRKEFEIIEGEASFGEDAALHILTADGEKVITGKKYVLAVGGKTFIPPIPGIASLPEGVLLTSRNIAGVLEVQEKKPESIVVLGGGAIGLELATFLNGVGVAVTLVERKTLLSQLDPECGEELTKMLTEDGISVITLASVTKLSYSDGGVCVSIERSGGGTEEIRSEKILLATGRTPALDTLKLEHIGLTLEKGRASFDKHTLVTDNPDVFVAGDASGTYQILHYASAMGRVAGLNVARGTTEETVDYDALNMGVIFTRYPVAHIGLTETAAAEKGVAVVSHIVRYAEIGRGILERQKYGLWKLTVAKESGRIVGSQIVGERADDLIHLVQTLMYFNATVQDVEKIVWYHPTYSEFIHSIASALCKKLVMSEENEISPGM